LANRLARLDPSNERPHHLILRALAKIGKAARRARPVLACLLEHENSAVRKHAAEVFEAIR